eukprot:TRINITY_DN103832_c0_g1_i1.p1 TRINITY_DN103832_c0_g1~~TRINITY_DN103832_c0_g1_i1.p1  ORF type:complete len:953 (+),score=235.81 TRINITY_DN103832_c0_g1_i1:110-2968(+)
MAAQTMHDVAASAVAQQQGYLPEYVKSLPMDTRAVVEDLLAGLNDSASRRCHGFDGVLHAAAAVACLAHWGLDLQAGQVVGAVEPRKVLVAATAAVDLCEHCIRSAATGLEAPGGPAGVFLHGTEHAGAKWEDEPLATVLGKMSSDLQALSIAPQLLQELACQLLCAAAWHRSEGGDAEGTMVALQKAGRWLGVAPKTPGQSAAALHSSPLLPRALHLSLLAVCGMIGHGQLAAGNYETAAAGLDMAHALLPSASMVAGGSGTHVEHWLLTRLAACCLVAGDYPAARQYAERAMDRSVPGYTGRDAAVRLAARAICSEAAAAPEGACVSPADWALRQKVLGGEDLLRIVRQLLDDGLVDTASRLLQGIRKKFLGNDQVCGSSRSSRLQKDVLSFEQVLASTPQAAVAAMQYNLGCRALERTNVEQAGFWLQRASASATLLPAGGDAALRTEEGLRAMVDAAASLCFLTAGDEGRRQAQDIASAALKRDASDWRAVAVLLMAAPDMLASQLQQLPPALQQQEGAGSPAAAEAAAGTAVGRAAFEAMPLAALAAVCDAVAGCAGAAASWACLRAVSSAATRGWLLRPSPQQSPEGLAQSLPAALLALAETASCASHASQAAGEQDTPLRLLSTLEMVSQTCQALRCFDDGVCKQMFQLLCNAASQLGEAGRWADCAKAFQVAYGVARQGVESAPESEDSGLCLLAHAAVLLEQARTSEEKKPELKRQLYILAADAAARARAAARNPAQTLPLLILMEFEARLQSHAAERAVAAQSGTATTAVRREDSVNSFLGGLLAAQVNLPPQCYAIMAQLALTAGHMEGSMTCLRLHLGAVSATAATGCPETLQKYAMALRELINLHAAPEGSYGCFEEALKLLQNNAGKALPYPMEELQWLISIAWNNGKHSVEAKQLAWARKWIAVALGLLHFCPALAAHRQQMQAAYNLCYSEGSTMQ